jgi:hypothetical protein
MRITRGPGWRSRVKVTFERYYRIPTWWYFGTNLTPIRTRFCSASGFVFCPLGNRMLYATIVLFKFRHDQTGN